MRTAPPLLRARFRANPEYKLVEYERLPPDEREALSALRGDPDFYGVLVPSPHSRREVKSVCGNTAALYRALAEPGPLPATVTADLDGDGENEIRRLLLDGVLEIESEGEFHSGPEAYGLVLGAARPPQPAGRLARRSIEALQYGQRLDVSDSWTLAVRLYFFGRIPLSPEWSRRLPSAGAVAGQLGLGIDGPLQQALDRSWRAVPPSPSTLGWLVWTSRTAGRRTEAHAPTYKLYVSPTPDLIGEALCATVDASSRLGVCQFKVGADVAGILRPDKLVVYFDAFEEVAAAADHIARELDGCPTHGVPFTAELAGDGLLSWGIDPPVDAQLAEWAGRESWRLWIAKRLAVALLAARESPAVDLEPWAFALERLRLEGIDTDTWAPAHSIWDHPAGERT